MLCIDLSSNNEPPDFRALKQHGVGGVWIKATGGHENKDGSLYANPFAQTWARRAREAGVRPGFYHYATADKGSALEEAAWFVDHVGKVGRRDLRPVLDYERPRNKLGGDELWIRAFNRAVKDATGVGPLFYSYVSLIEGLKLSAPVGYGLWLASYGDDDGKEHLVPDGIPKPWKKLDAHQYTSKGHVGTYGPVDLSTTYTRAVYAHPVTGLV